MAKTIQRAVRSTSFYVVMGLLVAAGVGVTIIPHLTNAGQNGAIWTTTGSCGEPQNINEYSIGDVVFINGNNFQYSNYDWDITGNPGGSSADPNIKVADGVFLATQLQPMDLSDPDSNYKFCFAAYTIAADDDGVYHATFGNVKGDNYHVDGIVCGNNDLETGEQCDDGNLISGDGCTDQCALEVCGDGIDNNNDAEECDNGDRNGLQCWPNYNSECSACASDCTIYTNYGPYCGDDIIQSEYEECDGLVGEFGDNEYCTDTCTIAVEPFCGDGAVNQLSEECDGTDNVGDNQRCSNECVLVDLPYCGDYEINQDSEECDGSAPDNYQCTDACLLEYVPYCGDSIKNGAEQCDDTDGVGDYQSCSDECELIDQTFDLHGYKWSDANNNGIRDCSYPLVAAFLPLRPELPEPQCEPLLSGWTIFIDENGNGVLDEGEQSATTDGSDLHFGWYWFEDLLAGEYSVCEVQQDGWSATYPASCHTVTLPYGNDGDTCYANSQPNAVISEQECNFGNYQPICGNGIIDTEIGETCDDNGMIAGDGCSAICTVEETDFRITKSVSVNGGTPTTETTITNEGDTLTYLITVVNTGQTDGTSLYIQDTLPTNTTLVGGSFGGDLAPISENDPFTWGPFDLTASESTTVTFDVTVNGSLPVGVTEISNQAKLFQLELQQMPTDPTSFLNRILGIHTAHAITFVPVFSDPVATSNVVLTSVIIAAQPVCGDNIVNQPTEECDGTAGITGDQTCSTSCTIVEPTPEPELVTPVLSLIKNVNKTFTNPGTTLTYTLTVSNSANVEATNVVLKDVLPAGLTFANPDGSNSGDTEKTWPTFTLAAFGDQTFTYDVLVDSNAPTATYTNTATVAATDVAEVTATADVEVRIPTVLGDTTPELTVTKTVGAPAVLTGGMVSYTVTVANVGDAVASNVTLTDLLPEGFTFSGSTDTAKDWALGDLLPGDEETITYDATVAISTAAGLHRNTATVTADELNPVTTYAEVRVDRRPVAVLGAEDTVIPDALPVTGAGIGLIVGLGAYAVYGIVRRKQ